jgi:hypothetical protein
VESIHCSPGEIHPIVESIHCPPGETHSIPESIHCPPGETHSIPESIHCPPGEIHSIPESMILAWRTVDELRGEIHLPPESIHLSRDEIHPGAESIPALPESTRVCSDQIRAAFGSRRPVATRLSANAARAGVTGERKSSQTFRLERPRRRTHSRPPPEHTRASLRGGAKTAHGRWNPHLDQSIEHRQTPNVSSPLHDGPPPSLAATFPGRR